MVAVSKFATILGGMEIDIEKEHLERAYPLLASLIVPRPIALVSTLGSDGVVNVAPFSFFNVLGANPPIVGFCPGNRPEGGPKDTARNIRVSHEFVVNLVDEATAEKMNLCASTLPYGESELGISKYTTVASSVVKPPRLAEAPASLECKEWGTLEIGGNRLIIGLVLRLHVRDEIFDKEKLRIITDNYFPIGRMMSPDWYCKTSDRFEMKRPG